MAGDPMLAFVTDSAFCNDKSTISQTNFFLSADDSPLTLFTSAERAAASDISTGALSVLPAR